MHDDILVPDVAGWRSERQPPLTHEFGLSVVPDWLCEVLDPSIESFDRTRKMPIYAREGVKHIWLLDPFKKTLEIFRLQDGSWRTVGVYEGDAVVPGEPFDGVELRLKEFCLSAWSAD